MKAKTFIISALLLSFASLALAGDVTINRCGMRFINALNRLEIKGASSLDIIEIKIDKPIDYIFGEHKLTMAPLASKFDEKKALYRYPGVAKRVLDRFESVKVIKDMPEKDIVKLLEPNAIYTYTIQDKKLTIAKSKPGIIRDFASKHMLLSSDESAGKLRMAGEMWADEKGILHYDPGSGTFKPGDEDLKRAEVFFKSHLGIESSQAHFFEAQVQATETAKTAPVKTSLGQKIKQIEAAQVAILQKRRVLAGYKFTIVSRQRMEEVETKLKVNTILLKDVNGVEAQYKLMKIESIVTEEVDFDDLSRTLGSSQTRIRQTRSFPLSKESTMKPMVLNTKASALKFGLGSDVKKENFVPVNIKRSHEVVYGLFQVYNGKTAVHPAFKIAMNRSTSKDQTVKESVFDKTEYSATIEGATGWGGDVPINLLSQIQAQLDLN